MNVFWHQRDLRIPDNSGLARATADDTTVPVYVLDPDLHSELGARQRAFLLDGLRSLKTQYRNHGSDLVILEGPPLKALREIVDRYDADRVVYNEHYRPARRARQRRVDAALPTESVTDLVLVDPEGLDPQYPTHSQFYNDWQAAPKPTPATPSTASLDEISDASSLELPEVAVDLELPEAGYDAARDRYDRFLAAGIETYSDSRDDLALAVERPVGAVSRLSPYLAAGMIGIREVWADATERYEAVSGDRARNVDKFRYELSWREQNYHLLYYNPDLLTENYKQFPNRIAWENDPDDFESLTRGETGYPLIDAGMRQLDQEGYIHNRPRQNVASFLTKHLLIDWRNGADYFAERLIDHDPANNYANWQWTASTGTDSVDVRIFDPVAQMAKYDDEAVYVKQYVPELRGVDAGTIVDWPTLSSSERAELAPDYSEPIVDRNAAYERAQRVFEEALGKR